VLPSPQARETRQPTRSECQEQAGKTLAKRARHAHKKKLTEMVRRREREGDGGSLLESTVKSFQTIYRALIERNKRYFSLIYDLHSIC